VTAADNANLYLRLMRAATDDPTRPLFHRPGRSTQSYEEVAERSIRMASALLEWGLVPGDRLVAQIAKSTDAIALWLACLRTGVVFVPLNTAYTDTEMGAFVDDADTGYVIRSPETASEVTLGQHEDGTFAELADRQPHDVDVPVAHASPDDPAAMLFTSGTTGRSKGAVLTHRGLLANAEALAEVWAITGEDRMLHTLPVFHVHGLFVALHPLMLRGAQITFLPRFDTAHVIDHLRAASVLMGVPTHYSRLLEDLAFTTEVTAGVRLFTSGSAPMTTRLHARFTERTGRTITERYGMTECGIITSTVPGEPRPGTVGRALPLMELRIGQDDIVEVRGPHLLDRYWRRPDATAASFTADGWFRTGDIGALDPEGVLTLSGRASDLIISGGYNIYPKEVEQAIDEDPRILESAVVGQPDEEWGETVVAFVVLEAGRESASFEPPDLSERLAGFKRPRRWEVVSDLPRNAMGKVEKNRLRSLPG
jgi:malonyl-CoA/methylmalonyl-CoA synthetase